MRFNRRKFWHWCGNVFVIACLLAGAFAITSAVVGCKAVDGITGADVRAEANLLQAQLAQTAQKLEEAKAAAARDKAEAEAAIAAAQNERDAAAARAAAVEAAAREAVADEGLSQMAALQRKADQALVFVNQATAPDGSIDPAGAAAAVSAVFPAATPFVALAGVAFGAWQRWQRSQDLKSVATAIDRVSNQNRELSSQLDDAWPKFEEALTPAAAKTINANSVT